MVGIAAGAVVGLLALAAPGLIGLIPTDQVVAERQTPTPAATPTPTSTATPTLVPTNTVESTPTPTPEVEARCAGVTPGTDSGARSGANGSVTASDAGLPSVYFVAGGDSYWSIADRFCLDSAVIADLNGIDDATGIYADTYLALAADAESRVIRLNEELRGGYRTHQDCDAIARIEITGDGATRQVSLSGTIIDSGSGEYAEGTVEKVDGTPTYYTVQPGDTYRGIGDRFCVDSQTVQAFNDAGASRVLQPGDRVQLRPTSRTIDWNE